VGLNRETKKRSLARRSQGRFVKTKGTFIQERGAAFVELVIALPLLLFIGFYFYDLSVTSLSRIWQQSTIGQFVRSIEQPPIRAKMFSVQSQQELLIAPLSDDELSTSYFPRLIEQLEFYMSNIGSGASRITHGAAAQLYFIEIDTGEMNAESAGYPTGAQLAMNDAFVTTPSSQGCFGDSRDVLETALNSYSMSRIQRILESKNKNLPPFGTNLFEVPIYNPVLRKMEYIDSYLEMKPLLFVLLCSNPFRFFSSTPITTLHTVFFDQEVQLQ